jgi:hypothetical protein
MRVKRRIEDLVSSDSATLQTIRGDVMNERQISGNRQGAVGTPLANCKNNACIQTRLRFYK